MALLSVLLVDDDITVHRAVRLRLRRAAALTCCQTAESALELVRNQKFDVALVDVNLGEEISGTRLIPLLRQVDADLAPVVFTAQADYRTAVDSIAARSFDFIPKSLDDDSQFLDKIGQAAARTREQREKSLNHRAAGPLRAALASAQVEGELSVTDGDVQRDLLDESLQSFSGLLGRIELMDLSLRQRGPGAPELADLTELSRETVAELHEYVDKLRGYFAEPSRAARSVNEILARAVKAVQNGSPELIGSRQIEFRGLKPDQEVPDDGRALLRAVVILLRLLLKTTPDGATFTLKASVLLNPSVELGALKNSPGTCILCAPAFRKDDRVAVAVEIGSPGGRINVEQLKKLFSPADFAQSGKASPWGALALVSRMNGALIAQSGRRRGSRYLIIFKV